MTDDDRGRGARWRSPEPSEADKAFFRSLVPDDLRVEVKPIFSNLGAFLNGNG
jgi:hypothetical protein